MTMLHGLFVSVRFSLLLVAGVGACAPTIPDNRFACERTSQCPATFTCTGGFCRSVAEDAGHHDGGLNDAIAALDMRGADAESDDADMNNDATTSDGGVPVDAATPCTVDIVCGGYFRCDIVAARCSELELPRFRGHSRKRDTRLRSEPWHDVSDELSARSSRPMRFVS
jgi:hypothetical protein